MIINKSELKKELSNYKDYIKKIKKFSKPHIVDAIELYAYDRKKDIIIFKIDIEEQSLIYKFEYGTTQILNVQECLNGMTKEHFKRMIDIYDPANIRDQRKMTDVQIEEMEKEEDQQREIIESLQRVGEMLEALEDPKSNFEKENFEKIKEIRERNLEKVNLENINNNLLNKEDMVEYFADNVKAQNINILGVIERINSLNERQENDEMVIDYIKDGFYFLGIDDQDDTDIIFTNLTNHFLRISMEGIGIFDVSKPEMYNDDTGFFDKIEEIKKNKVAENIENF